MSTLNKMNKTPILYLVNDAIAVGNQKKAGKHWGQKWLGAFQKMNATLKMWNERSQSRNRLADLSPRLIEDIGLTPADVEKEVEKYFWQA